MQVDPYAAMNGLTQGFEQQQMMAQSRARRQAGNALAGGDMAGAAGILGQAGDLQSQRAIGQDMTRQADQMREREQQERTEKLTFILQGAEGLLQVPPDQRREVYQTTLRPVLQQMGYPDDILAQLDSADMSDAELRSLVTAVGGEVRPMTAGDRTAGGSIVRPDPYTGEYSPVYTAPERMAAPAGYRVTEAGDLEFIPGGPADPRVVGTRAAAGRAPPRPRSGNSGVNGSARPGSQGEAAPAPRRPWERY